MSRIRPSLSLRALLVLTLLILGTAFLRANVIVPRSELGTPAEQEAVRTDRETLHLPIRSTCTVVPAKELFITSRSVVDDCWRTTWSGNCASPGVSPARRGAWTFGGLLPGIFGTNDPADLSRLALRWFVEWETTQVVNGESVPARPKINDLIVEPWLQASGGTQLDMKKAPFRLLAIVSRLDLRQNSGYSEGFSAGEARFIFNVLYNGQPTEFNVIVEYGLDAEGCADVLDWANAWHDLGTHAFGDDYNAALDALTNRFTKIGASPAKKNRSAIEQVRTNEIELVLGSANPLWELREFHLKDSAPEPAPLVQRTVDLTPARIHHRTALLADFINTNEAAILRNQHVVPGTFQQQPFRGGTSINPKNLGWDGPGTPCSAINSPKARHIFSLNTCSGCHGHETGVDFKHVEPRAANAASVLSPFLTGGSATDRCGQNHHFGDIERRRVDLCQLLEKTCTQINNEPVVTFAH